MSAVGFEIIFILLLLVANGVFAMSEMALVSARKARLQQRAGAGDARARAALELANAPDTFLSTVQVGITLVGILAGAFGGSTLAKQLAAQAARVPALAPYGEAIGLGVVVLAITYLSLVVGELAPKRLALNNPEKIASMVARPMRALSRLASPVVRLLSFSTASLLKAFGVTATAEPPVTEEEIRVLIHQGAEAGVFEHSEREIVESVFRLDDRRVTALMTPRLEIVWLDADAPPEAVQLKLAESHYSRFPVARGNLDNVLGIAKAKDLLGRCLAGQTLDLRASSGQPLFVPESQTALQLLELFKNAHTHFALVVDEYGSVQGLVTMHDVLEALVGDMPTAGAAEAHAVERGDGSWLLDGTLLIDEFREIFPVGMLPGEERGGYETLAGFVLTCMGRVPRAADYFEWGGLRFEVVDMDGRRVDKVLVAPATPGAAHSPDNGD
ncbi:MAG TPA: hemolysin family protein [Pyrinomonadaceae bacterium]